MITNKGGDVTKVEHVYCDKNDRWMYIEYNDNREIIGLNFMQGSTSPKDYGNFKKRWCVNDINLMHFYSMMLYTFPVEKASVSTLSFINKCMWAHFSAVNRIE